MVLGERKKSWWRFLVVDGDKADTPVAADINADTEDSPEGTSHAPFASGMGGAKSDDAAVDVSTTDAAESNAPAADASSDSPAGEIADAAPEDGDEAGEDQDDHDSDESGPLPHNVEPLQDDPLGEAYDLELGSKLTRGGGDDMPWRSDVQSAKEFFNTEILYLYDILTDDEQQALAGSYRIELRGQSGGVWTVTLKEQLDVVNRREEADIVFSMSQRDFLNLVNGRLNPQLAVLSQKLRITGDIRRGVAFQSILTPNGD